MNSYDILSFRPMRILPLILITSCLPCCGCSMLIAYSGYDVTKLSTQEEVHQKFGEPVSTEIVDGQLEESYRTRWKLSDPKTASAMPLILGTSSGLLEFYAFPNAVYNLAKGTLLGQKVCVRYTLDGKVETFTVDNSVMDWAQENHEYPRQFLIVDHREPTADSDSSNPFDVFAEPDSMKSSVPE